jgi:hypothetical protein
MLDPFIRLRSRFERLSTQIWSSLESPVEGSPAFVGQVVADGKEPTSTGRYFRVAPVLVLGSEAEGGQPNLSVSQTLSTLVCVVGTTPPLPGDYLVCRFVGSRWVAERFGASGGGGAGNTTTIVGCLCSAIPTTLTLSSSGPCVAGDFQNCTIQWTPTPAAFANLGLGGNCFLSTTDLVDPSSGRQFRYTLGCSSNYFNLSRVYEPTAYGPAYLDSTIYDWAIGVQGNTCSPFLLSNGTIYSGGNPNCLVVISQ